MESIDDLVAPWTRHGAGLAARMLVLADEIETRLGHPDAADVIREVIRCEYDPLKPDYPPLGVPPALRPPFIARLDPGA